MTLDATLIAHLGRGAQTVRGLMDAMYLPPTMKISDEIRRHLERLITHKLVDVVTMNGVNIYSVRTKAPKRKRSR